MLVKHLEDHSIYGDWDDTYCNEVLIYKRPNEKHCYVFVMGGSDYGGGIMQHGKCSVEDVEKLLQLDDAYALHRGLYDLLVKREPQSWK